MAPEWKQALRIVWLAVSAAGTLVLLASVPPAAPLVARFLPVCEAKARGHRECALCGMTAAFQSISRGGWRDAPRANRGALPLYLLLLSNQAAAAGWVFSRVRRARRGESPCRY